MVASAPRTMLLSLRCSAHQAVVKLMTDKFTVELEAPQAGIPAGIRPGCGKGAEFACRFEMVKGHDVQKMLMQL